MERSAVGLSLLQRSYILTRDYTSALLILSREPYEFIKMFSGQARILSQVVMVQFMKNSKILRKYITDYFAGRLKIEVMSYF
jgi:hypothetical protein